MSITEIGAIFIGVADQERALAFYVDLLGFEKRVDFEYGGGIRWVEVAPPGATNTIALAPAGEGSAPAGDAAHCAFAVGDLDTLHARLREHGVDVDPIAGEGSSRPGLIALDVSVPDPVPKQCGFRDPDGNRFLLVQPG